jgi:hypothetical protein
MQENFRKDGLRIKGQKLRTCRLIPTALKIDLRPVSGGDRGDALFVVGEEHPSFA